MPEHVTPHPNLAGYVLGVLDADEAAAFETHLDACADCAREVTELQPLTAALDEAAPAMALPPGLAARTFAAIEREAAGHGPEDEVHSGPPTTPGPNGRRRARLLTAGAAVTAIAALVAGVLLATRPSSGARTERTAHVALVSDVGGRAGTVTLRRTSDGVVIDLAVAGLPPSRDDERYECWYLSPTDAPDAPDRISAGTFTVGADGRADVRMTTAADPAEYPRISVNRVPGGGDPSVFGEPVLWSRWSPGKGTVTG